MTLLIKNKSKKILNGVKIKTFENISMKSTNKKSKKSIK